MKVLRNLLLALLMVVPLFAEQQHNSATFALRYDVDSSSLTYVRLVGQNEDPYGGSKQGKGTIKTTGSSTTVDENVASSNPFADIAVGDVIEVTRAAVGVTDVVVVTAKASDAQITVDTAVDWSAGYSWRYWDQQSGTASTDGWIDTAGASSIMMTVQYDQGDLDGLRVRWECLPYGLGANPVIVYPGETSDCGIGGTLSTDRCNFATAGPTARLSVLVETAPFSRCRVGLAYAATDTSDAGANVEQVTVTLATIKE